MIQIDPLVISGNAVFGYIPVHISDLLINFRWIEKFSPQLLKSENEYEHWGCFRGEAKLDGIFSGRRVTNFRRRVSFKERDKMFILPYVKFGQEFELILDCYDNQIKGRNGSFKVRFKTILPKEEKALILGVEDAQIIF